MLLNMGIPISKPAKSWCIAQGVGVNLIRPVSLEIRVTRLYVAWRGLEAQGLVGLGLGSSAVRRAVDVSATSIGDNCGDPRHELPGTRRKVSDAPQ